MSELARRLGVPDDEELRCLAIGAHPDDIEIGAGGTLLRLTGEHPAMSLTWVVLSAAGERITEAEQSARRLAGSGTRLRTRILDGRDGHLPYGDVSSTKEALAAAADPPPHLVFVHRRDDAHQDHRLANELAWQVCRWSTILEYEIPKWDGDTGPANLYVSLEKEHADQKVSHLLEAFPSQAAREWFTSDTFRATLRLRGIEARAPSGLAEGFVARKLTI